MGVTKGLVLRPPLHIWYIKEGKKRVVRQTGGMKYDEREKDQEAILYAAHTEPLCMHARCLRADSG